MQKYEEQAAIALDISDRLRTLANSITPMDAMPNQDASGGYVSSLTEAVMGMTAGLQAVAGSLSEIALAIDNHG